MDRIILGDNQFNGINHRSEEKEAELSQRFSQLSAVTSLLETAYEQGVHAFMLNTNDRSIPICDHLRKNAGRFSDLRLYPSLPYPHKYANAVAEKGIFGALTDIIVANNSAGNIFGMIARGGLGILQKDALQLMKLLIDTEMKMFRGLNVKVVFLQNIITDLLLGYRLKDFVRGYAEYIQTRFNAEPGFITLNLPQLVDFLEECGLKNPIVCASINKSGYLMNPGIPEYEKAIAEKEFRPMAMSILASGAISAREAVDYVVKQPRIQSIVYGASSRAHIRETRELIEQAWNSAGNGRQ